MDTIKAIKTRRSVRKYTCRAIEDSKLDTIIQSAICAPSGKNGQPWKFRIIVEDDLIYKLSELSIYGSWMKTARCFVVVFLDKNNSYNYVKDVQSVGAAIQNILLSAHSLGIGSCWIGEILEQADKVNEILQINDRNYELMGVITLGYIKDSVESYNRKPKDYFIL